MPHGKTWQVVAVSAAIGVAVSAGAVAAAGPWESGQRTAERRYAADRDQHADGHAAHQAPPGAAGRPAVTPPAPSAPPVLAAAGTGTPPDASTLAARLDPLMAADGLGPVRTGVVIDAATGRVLYDHRSGTAATPASTTKLATAAAALATLGPDHRLSTTVVATAAHRIVLVGGGDPTFVPEQLAADTAAALKARGTTSVRLGYDTSYYSGPVMHPIGVNTNLSPVTALMVREGRLDDSASGTAEREGDPAGAAAKAFAALLRGHGITVTGEPAPARGAGGTQLAVHQSGTLSALVERMLTNSDNDIAEALARQVAHAAGQPASFAGGAKAIGAALRGLGVPLGGAVFTDGSGLAHADALPAVTLARILALAADPRHPELRSILTGLPVAAFTGTLSSRFQATPGAGLIHAKTGTLTGTNTIAGTTVTASGRLLTFAFMTEGTTNAPAAQSALDHLASTLTHP